MLVRALVPMLSLCNSRACKFASYAIKEDLHIHLEKLIVQHAQTKLINSRVFWTLNASVNKPHGLEKNCGCTPGAIVGNRGTVSSTVFACLNAQLYLAFFSVLKMFCSFIFKNCFEDICHFRLFSCISEALTKIT